MIHLPPTCRPSLQILPGDNCCLPEWVLQQRDQPGCGAAVTARGSLKMLRELLNMQIQAHCCGSNLMELLTLCSCVGAGRDRPS